MRTSPSAGTARYQIAPLGRGSEQVASHRRLLKPGGSLVLEEWDLASFRAAKPVADFPNCSATSASRAGIDAHVIALKPGHPYLRLPLQFSVALESRLLETLSEDELAALRREAEAELAEPGRWGTTFTLIQTWGRLSG